MRDNTLYVKFDVDPCNRSRENPLIDKRWTTDVRHLSFDIRLALPNRVSLRNLKRCQNELATTTITIIIGVPGMPCQN